LVSDLARATRRAHAEFRGCSTARRTTSACRKCLAIAKDFDHVIINTSTPSLKNDCKVAEAIKAQKPGHENRFRRRAHDGVADGNAQGVARD
jgi:isocitrate lyase